MNETFWSVTNVAGLLLLASALIPIGGIITLVMATGYRPVIGGSLPELERIATGVTAHRWALTFWTIGYLAMLSGFGVLTSRLQESNNRAIPSIALIGIIIVFVFVALEATFHMSVTTWVAENSTQDPSLPDLYQPLRLWFSVYGQYVYTIIGLLAIAGYGWIFLQTEHLPDLVGWASISWGVLWIAVFIVFRTTIPGTLLVMPAVIGIFLLL